MSEPYPHIDDDETFWAPGTVRLEDCMFSGSLAVNVLLTPLFSNSDYHRSYSPPHSDK